MVASTMHNPHYLPERGDVVDIKAIGGTSLMSSQMQPVLSVSSSVSVSESLAAAVQMLVNLNEEEFLTSLTPDSYQQLTAVQAALSTVVGEDENHLFAPLATFISNLIKDREDEPKTFASDKVRPVRGLAVAAAGEDKPDYTTARLSSLHLTQR